jgi:hypothetical protein
MPGGLPQAIDLRPVAAKRPLLDLATGMFYSLFNIDPEFAFTVLSGRQDPHGNRAQDSNRRARSARLLQRHYAGNSPFTVVDGAETIRLIREVTSLLQVIQVDDSR